MIFRAWENVVFVVVVAAAAAAAVVVVVVVVVDDDDIVIDVLKLLPVYVVTTGQLCGKI